MHPRNQGCGTPDLNTITYIHTLAYIIFSKICTTVRLIKRGLEKVIKSNFHFVKNDECDGLRHFYCLQRHCHERFEFYKCKYKISTCLTLHDIVILLHIFGKRKIKTNNFFCVGDEKCCNFSCYRMRSD